VFFRFATNLDLWQMYMTDPDDFMGSWTTPREGSCVDQDQNTGTWWCIEPRDENYWIVDSPVFPTSNPNVLNDPKDGRLVLYFRTFQGGMYMLKQSSVGNSTHWDTPTRVGDNIVE
jgi:hypothetical protein